MQEHSSLGYKKATEDKIAQKTSENDVKIRQIMSIKDQEITQITNQKNELQNK